MRKICFALVIFGLLTGNVFAEPLKLKYFQTDNRYSYRIDLLRMAMENTVESDGPYEMVPVTRQMTQSRGLHFLEKGEEINICFLASNKERESRFLSIKIPILRGLLGYRVSLIRKESLPDFEKIETLDQLTSNFKAGFGSQWADMKILKVNQIPVVDTCAQYENLFKMLSGKRFDYFPRGINEAWVEIADRKETHPDLVVDPYLALYYPYPVYFFVNKNDAKLADRIERGLKIAQDDGSFKDLFLKYHADIIRQAGLENRRMFVLENPTLAPDMPEPDTGWWLEKQ